MARERMITRTILETEVEVICMNVNTVEPQIKTFTLTGLQKNNDYILKQLKKQHETDSFKLVAIQNVQEKESMYGMKEIDFIKLATKLDPETRKVVE